MAATFGSVLARHLAQHGWSQRAFARRVGTSQSLVARIVSGSRRPPLEQVADWIAQLALPENAAAELARLALAAHGAAPLLDLLHVAAPARAADRGTRYASRER